MEDIPEVPLMRKQSSNLRCPTSTHQDSMLEFICLNPKCTSKRLICSECHKSSHNSHEVMQYNVFTQLCNDKTVQLKSLQSSVEDEIKKSEIKHIESLNQIKDNFTSFIDQIIENQSDPFFQNLRQRSNALINPDIINTAISTLREKMETAFDAEEINNQLEIIAQNLTYSDEQLGLKLQFGPGLFTSKIVNEINGMTEVVNSFFLRLKENLQNKMERIYNLTSKNIEELSKKMNEIVEKTDFNKLKLLSEKSFPVENDEISTFEVIRNNEGKEESNLLAIGLKSGRVKIFNLEKNEPVKKFYAHEAECFKLLYVQENMSLYSSGLDHKLSVWKVSDGFSFQTSLDSGSSVFSDFCSIGEERLLAMISGKTLSLTQHNLIKLTSLQLEDVLSKVAYINSMQTVSRLICGDVKGSLHYLDVIEGGENLKQAFRNYNVHSGLIVQIHILDKKDLVITVGSEDARIIFHNTTNFQQVKEFKYEFGILRTFYDSFDETIFLDCGRDELALFNLQSETVEKKLKSSKSMSNYVWVRSMKILACSRKEENKSSIFCRYFE